MPSPPSTSSDYIKTSCRLTSALVLRRTRIMEILVLLVALMAAEAAPPGRIVFPDSKREERKIEEPITPPVLPVIPHLENDPSTLRASDNVAPRNAKPKPEDNDVKPRFGFNHGFDVSPNSDGGLTATYNNGFSGLGGHSQSVAHSASFGFNNGFQVSQSSSGASSFNNGGFVGSSFSGSQANSQASSFSAGTGGLSASSAAASASASSVNGHSSSNSQSASFGTNFNGNTATGSQSASSAFGSGNTFSNSAGSAANFGGRPGNRPSGNTYSRPGHSHNSNQNNFGVGSIDIRQRPNYQGVAATSIVFPKDRTRGGFDSSEEIITFVDDDDRWRASSYKKKNDGDIISDWLSILISD